MRLPRLQDLPATVLAFACLAGCTPQAARVELPAEVPGAFSAAGAEAAPERWWRAFDDPELDRLVETALRDNFDLETAWHRLREARAVVDREAAGLFPALDGEAQGEVRSPGEGESPRLRLGLAAEYEIDLWGRIRSSVEAERFRAQASLEDYRAAALSLSAEVARTWFQLLEARGRQELLADQVETNGKVLRLIEHRFARGLVRSVDFLRQRQLVEATREELSAAEAGVRVLEHQLAVLLGRSPRQEVAAPGSELPGLPPLPQTGLPVELLRRRPDLRRAHDLLRAADREVAAAIAERYPRLTLAGSLSSTNQGADQLFDDWVAALGAGLLAPLLDGGRRAAEVDRTEALRDQRLYEYAQATLAAFREVEDALVRERRQLEQIASLETQVRLAEEAYRRLRSEYFNGAGDYIEVLTALTQEQETRRELLAARRELLELRIALYRALAGGFGTGRETGDAPPA